MWGVALAGRVEWQLDVPGKVDQIGEGVLQGQVLQILGGENVIWR